MRYVAFLVRLLTAGLLTGAAVAGPNAETRSALASTSTRTLEFDLPAQSAATALIEFSKQAKIEVLFSFEALSKATSQAVTGRYEPEEALKRLLQGTGFSAKRNGGEKYVVTPAVKSTGKIKGKLLTPEGTAARGIRVSLLQTAHSAVTDKDGDFEISSLGAGHYQLVAQAKSCQPLHLPDLYVEPDHVLELSPQMFRRAADPARLAPYVVKDRTTRRDPFDRSEAELGPRTAGSNLDLARTENDALPFNIYNRDQIARSGVVNLNEFLQRELLDADASTSPPEQNGLLETFTAGSTNLNLRGFGADQTIVLVNGRRLPEALIQGSGSQTPDVNFIPLSLVQQVEVLPISAASLYAGNAVGGIINIVLRPGVDAEATEVALTYSNAFDYDAPQTSASILHSRTLLGGALRVRFNASIAHVIPPTEMEVKYRQSRTMGPLPLSSSVYRATPNIRSIALVPTDESGLQTTDPPVRPPLFGTALATVTSVAPGADGNGGIAAFNGREGIRNFAFFDSPGGMASSPESVDYPYGRKQLRTAYFASAVYDVFPWLQIGLDGTYTRSVQHRGFDVMSADLRLRAENPFNPFGQEASVSLNEMAPELGERHSEARLEFGAAVFSALFKLPRDWRLLLDSQYGQNIAKYRGIAGADYARWQELVDTGRYNPLRDTQIYGPPQEFYDRVLIHRGGLGRFVTLGDYSTIDAAIRATHHSLSLPTGRGAVNFGGDYRRNSLASHQDERRFADGTLASEPVSYRGRTLERYSIFGEVQAPLVPEAWLPRAIRSLDADFAVRYIAANDSKESNVAPTFALKMKLPAGFSLRGSVSTSSRFPTPQMSRLAVTSPTLPGAVVGVDVKPAYDPVQKQTYVVQHDEILNPDLEPEAALTQTAGIIFRTGNEHRFRAALDFVDTRKVNELIGLDVQTILNLEHLFPDRVIRAKEPGPDGRTGDVISVITGTINSSWRRSHNWNASFDYAWTECLGGTLEAYSRLLYYSKYQHLLLPGANVVDELSHPEVATNLLRYRAKFGASWSNRNLGLGFDGHYFHSRIIPQKEWVEQGRDRIRPFTQFDVFIQGNIGQWMSWLPNGLRAQLRVNNVFATPYPRYNLHSSGSGIQPYGDWRGRVYSLSLMTTF